LPQPKKLKTPPYNVITQRKSHREFMDKEISIEDVSTILWMGYGLRERVGNFFFRNVPSAGALYPLEIYVGTFKVEGLSQGIYHFNPVKHTLECILEGNFKQTLVNGCLGQHFVSTGAIIIFISSVFRRNMAKYGHRGLRYILLDAGHLAQNMILGAEALGLGSCPVGAFFDDELNQLIGLDGYEESVLYLLVIGKKD